MIIVISAGPAGEAMLSIDQPDDCGSFHLEARGVDRQGAVAVLARTGAGSLVGDDAFIEPATVERLAAGSVGADWEERFAGMLAYAEKKGWIDSTGAVQAHVEWS
jgi:hypothetical protein